MIERRLKELESVFKPEHGALCCVTLQDGRQVKIAPFELLGALMFLSCDVADKSTGIAPDNVPIRAEIPMYDVEGSYIDSVISMLSQIGCEIIEVDEGGWMNAGKRRRMAY